MHDSTKYASPHDTLAACNVSGIICCLYRPPNTLYVFTAYCTTVLTDGIQINLENSNIVPQMDFPVYLEDQTQATNKMSLGKTNIKHCQIMRLYELDIRDNTAETVVEFNSSLGRYRFIFQIKHYLMIAINP